MKKICNFCGAPLKDSAKECEQCGWDRSQDGPPSADPADTKARIGVAAGLVVAYVVMGFLIQGAPDVASATPAANNPIYTASEPISEPSGEPVVAQAIAVGAPPPTGAAAPATVAATTKLLTMKVADDKAAHIQAHSALNYDFILPETEQKCQLVGRLHGSGGFDSGLETFLLTDDEYLFWHANPAAIPHSSWDTIRGSETTLSYELPGAGTYHLVISNEMSPTNKTVQVRAQVKCAR
ncbi:MAG: zinc ribbon domain-containing protein [Gemmatimonadaceae bacterium]